MILRYLILGSLLLPIPLFAQFSMPRPIEVSETDEVYQLAAGDVDGNGSTDVVVASHSNHSVCWYPNMGAGLFDHREPVSSEVQDACLVNLSDLDGDGDLDVLTGERSSGTVSWFENDGSGAFLAEHVVTDSARSPSVSIGDVDGDSDLDLFVCSRTDNWLAWFENLGGGVFSSPIGVLSAPSPVGALLADIDGDGDPDAVHVRGVAPYLQINNGNGSFGSAAGLGGNNFQASMTSADVDLDGDTDLLGISYARIAMYENLGGGTFAPMSVVTEDVSGGLGMSIADLNADGYPDLVSASENDDFVASYANDGTGEFPVQVIISTELDGASTCAVGDIDGDGDADLVAGSLYNDRVAWFANDGAGTFTIGQVISNAADGANSVYVLDLNSDGSLDVLTGPGLDGADGVDIYTNQGNGLFGSEHMVQSLPWGIFYVIDPVDLDGDGFTDVVASTEDGVISWVRNNGGTWDAAIPIASGLQDQVSIGHGDLDGDSDVDLICTDYLNDVFMWFENLGNGAMGPQQVIANPLSPAGQHADDLDNDGDLDISYWSGGTANWLSNNGGSFGPPQVIAVLAGLRDMKIGDLDGDGFVDAVLCGWSGNQNPIQWSRNVGGTFDPPQIIDDTANTWPDDLDLADLDGDGDLDVLVAYGYQHPITWFENDGTGAFGPAQPMMPLSGMFGAVVTGDLDGDGDMDVVGSRTVGEDLLWAENYLTGPFRVSGTAFMDLDLNGVHDPNEQSLPGVLVDGEPCYCITSTPADGSYVLAMDSGAYAIQAGFNSPYWTLTSDSASFNGTLTTNDPLRANADFGFGPTMDTSLVTLSMTVGPVPCGGTTTLWLSVSNSGTRVEQGLVSMVIDQEVTLVGFDPAPDSVQGNLIWWSFDSLQLFSSLSLEAIIDIPLTQGPNAYLYTAEALTLDTLGTTTGTFDGELLHPFGCSYDPNDKQVHPAGYGAPGAVDIATANLDYTIRFQNTGTAPAFNVMLRDHLSSRLDRTGFQVLGSSHSPSHISIEQDGELVVRFDNIMLPDSGADFPGSQGFIKFRIGILPGLSSGTVIENTAEIYFDYNAPVITNTTLSTLVDCDLWEPVISVAAIDVLQVPEGDRYQWFLNGVALLDDTTQLLFIATPGDYSAEVTSIYGCVETTTDYQIVITGREVQDALQLAVVPNPFNSTTRLLFDRHVSPYSLIEVVDLHGRVLRSLSCPGSREVTIERDGLAQGLYLLRISDGGVQLGSVRLVVE